MNGSKLLVDTNIVLYFLKGNTEVQPFFYDYDILLSFITELEILAFDPLSKSEERSIKNFLDYVVVLDINSAIKKKTIQIKKKYRLKLPDAIIAATALTLDLPLLTADKAFAKIKDNRIVLFEL